MVAVTDPVGIHDENLEFLRAALPSTYTNIRFFIDGGTRRCYLADWGPGGQKRVIKIDKKPEGPRAERHVERGCTTTNDLVALSRIPDPGAHHLSALVDFYEIGNDDEKRLAVVEPYFDGATLEEIVSERPLNREEFEKVFANVLDGSSYLIGTAEMYHRDLKPSNILVDRETGNVRITDLANARRKEEVKLGYQPTVGGHLVTDPRLLGPFTGNETVYDEAAEVYALGMNMYFALTGEYPFEYDPDKGVARDLKTEESLLNKGGKIDAKKHNKALARALKKIPRESKKYRELIRRCLTLEDSTRHRKLDNLVQSFEFHRSRDNYFNLNSPKGAIASILTLAVVGMLGAVGSFVYRPVAERFKPAVVAQENEKPTYTVQAEWDGGKLELSNNLVEADFTLSHVIRNRDIIRDVKRLQPGDRLGIVTHLRYMPGTVEAGVIYSPHSARVYIEGFEGKETHIYPGPHDTSIPNEGFNVGGSFVDLDVPKDIAEGVHALVLEVYAPDRKIVDTSRAKIVFPQPGRALVRQRLPVIVGEPRETVDLKSLKLGDWRSMAVYPIRDGKMEILGDVANNVSCQVSVPEEGFVYEPQNIYGNSYSGTPNLPDGTSTEDRTFQLVCRRDAELIGYTFLPLERSRRYEGAPLEWRLAIPDRGFSDRLVAYRKAIESKDKPR